MVARRSLGPAIAAIALLLSSLRLVSSSFQHDPYLRLEGKAFPPMYTATFMTARGPQRRLFAEQDDESEILDVTELGGVDDIASVPIVESSGAPSRQPDSAVAPFLSQGEVSEDALRLPNLNDPKETRVIIYMILSLVPIVFLVPLMLGSRDLIPLDALPPVELN
jgi:hypothetical protein